MKSPVCSCFCRNNSVVMLNVARAHLSMTDDMIQDTKTWFRQKEYPNGLFTWQGHGDYMSEQTAVGALINEMLMQSVGGIIRVFPAWPEEKDASFANLRARGGFLVSAEMKQGQVVCLKIISTVGGALKLVSPWQAVTIKGGGTDVSASLSKDKIVSLDTSPAGVYLFSR